MASGSPPVRRRFRGQDLGVRRFFWERDPGRQICDRQPGHLRHDLAEGPPVGVILHGQGGERISTGAGCPGPKAAAERQRVPTEELGELRVQEPPAEGGVLELASAPIPGGCCLGHHVRRPGHGLDTAGHEDVAVVEGNRVRRRVDGLQPRAAEPVDGLAGDLDGRPASSSAIRATLRLSSPAWLAQPRITSSISAGSIPDRSTTALIASAARSSGRTAARAPAIASNRSPDGLDDPRLARGPLSVSLHDAIVREGPRQPRRGFWPGRRELWRQDHLERWARHVAGLSPG
jgi:hypothetical protein